MALAVALWGDPVASEESPVVYHAKRLAFNADATGEILLEGTIREPDVVMIEVSASDALTKQNSLLSRTGTAHGARLGRELPTQYGTAVKMYTSQSGDIATLAFRKGQLLVGMMFIVDPTELIRLTLAPRGSPQVWFGFDEEVIN